MRMKMSGGVALAILAFAAQASAQVRINEILANQGTSFDGAEYIELYNPTGAGVSIAGWVLTGTENGGTCGGERYWQFPGGTTIAAGGYIVVTRDNDDTVPSETEDGFEALFGFNADFEMYDSGRTYESDDPGVPNLILLNGTASDDQIRFMPGAADYAMDCAQLDQYEALYLYNGSPIGGGVIIDVFEYDNPGCAGDQCLGIGASNNDALDVVPGVGESLGRNATGTDTNNSSLDFFLSTPTPKAANVPNAGPTLSNLALSNPDPFVGETVPVSITAVDANGIGSVKVFYRVNGGALDSLTMVAQGNDLYLGTIPSQPDQAIVDFYVRARDSGAPVGSSKYPFFGTRSVRWGTQTIFQCQFHSPASDSGKSVEVGRPVNVHGVVTTESGPFNTTSNVMFTLQNGTGFWNGIHVFDPLGTTTVARGDSVRVSGVVQEYFGRTELVIFGGTNVRVLATNRPVPAATTVTCSQLTTGSSIGEVLEGVLVKALNVTVTNDSLGFGEWMISDGTGSCRVDDDAFYNYNPTNGDSLDAVYGIVDYTFSDRKLEPRGDGDIQGPPIVSNVRYSPIPPTFAAGAITITATIVDNGSIAVANLLWSTNNGTSYTTVAMTNTSGTTWSKAIGPFANGLEVDYHIEVTDNEGFPGRAPAAGNYDLYVGMRNIDTVQSSVLAGTDASIFDGMPTNIAGIVTMAPGMLADNSFVIQNHWTTDPAFRGIEVYSGGSLVGQLVLGDSVAVSGDVDEYFGKTEVRMHFTEAFHKYNNQVELQGYTLNTSAFGPDSTGAMPPAEQWEGVLLQFNGSQVTNAVAGFGQYYIDNTAPLNAQETLVDDEARVAGLTYVPTLGDQRTYRGIGDFTFGQYKLQPRNDSDILPFNPGSAVDAPVVAAPLRFALHQNAPNPIDKTGTRIWFALPKSGNAKLSIFDVQGRRVRTLVNGPVEAGRHAADWNGKNDEGHEVSSGVYFYRLTAGENEATRKMTFLR